MSSPHDPDNPVYGVGGKLFSIHDLLERFADPKFMRNGIPRISDLHLKVGEPARYRFDNDLIPLAESTPLTGEIIGSLLFPLLGGEHIDKLGQTPPLDVDAGYEWLKHQLNFRINAFHDRDGLACAIRVLPRTIPALEDIGFPDNRTWWDIVNLKQGLVIITGVTGSGKSTTISSLLQYINRNQRARIITLEDPVEYVLTSKKALISQRELGKHVHSFHEGLRAALREDPDIIFVGEIRDQETASLALTAAETGHLVMTTLHTRDTAGAITRIVDLFPADRTKELCSQLSFSLNSIIGQKLVQRADGEGRRVAMEVLKNINALANLIRSGNWHHIYSTLETQTKEGLMSLERHLINLVQKGEITRDVALQAANKPDSLAQQLH